MFNWKYVITLKNVSREFKSKNIDQTRNYFLKDMQNELMSRKDKKVCTIHKWYWTLFYFLASAITGYISISTFASLLGIPLGITSSEIGLKTCVIAAWYKNYKPIIKKKKKKQN